ncbi:MAG: hypothetical protein KGY80_03685 [Candidatus Thorarchaeota archaeon]|nr:hypothetical protein [Candidatus Thorarchaeota archaeon]
MNNISAARSWLWILKYWTPIYLILTVTGLFSMQFFSHNAYSLVFLIGIPVLVVPITYQKLVGGGCSLKYRICALVRGMLAGVLFLALAYTANLVLQIILAQLSFLENQVLTQPYEIWFFSGAIGGFLARIAEVRGQSMPVQVGIGRE